MAKVTVMAYEKVVRFLDGEVRDVYGPGRHRYRRWLRSRLERVDLRPRLVPIAGQEVFTADGLVVRASVVLTVAVVDPVRYLVESQDPNQELYLATQVALRDAAAGLTLEALLAARTTLPERLRGTLAPAAARHGVELREVALRDLMLPGELRRAYAETALARERGRAELERARAEAAALRSLANTAKLLEDHPALLQLRTLQTAGGPGTTIVLAAPGTAPPVGRG